MSNSFPLFARLFNRGLLIALLATAAAHANPAARQGDWQRIVGISRQAIANPAWLETSEWRDFLAQMGELAGGEIDNETFRAEFNQRARKLPFSHYQLLRTPRGEAATEPAVELRWHDAATAVMVVRQFDESPERMHAIVAELRDASPTNLILDLRELSGGAFPSAVALGRYLGREAVDTGVYLSRRWFAEHGTHPDPAEIAAIEPLGEMNLDVFRERLRTTGVLRLVLPAHDEPIFTGRLIVLTSGRTASAGEPFVYSLRGRPGVTVIGERTAGQMLSGQRFPINAEWQLFVPVADYLTPEGTPLDRVGVPPQVETSAAEALARAVALLAEPPAGEP